MICVRTNNVPKMKQRVEEIVNDDKGLSSLYDWWYYTQNSTNYSHNSQNEILLENCNIENIVEALHHKMNRNTILLETGPTTVFPYFKNIESTKMPISSIFLAVHIGELPKDALVYGKLFCNQKL